MLLKCFRATQTGGAAEFQFLLTEMTSVISLFVSCDPLFCVRYEVDGKKTIGMLQFPDSARGLALLTLFLGLGLFWHVNCYVDPLAET